MHNQDCQLYHSKHFKENTMKKKILGVSLLVLFIGTGWLVYNRFRVVIPAVDVNKSEIAWSAKSLSGPHTGKIMLSKANLEFQGGKLIGGSFEADMTSITVTDISDTADNRHFVEHISDADFFEVNKFPKASFTITKATPLNEQDYEVTGTMRIKEQENPMTFKATVTPAGTGQRVSALVTVDRTKFGIEYGSKGKPGSEPDWFILDEFILNINVVTSENL